MGAGIHGGFGETSDRQGNSYKESQLIAELEKQNVKFSKEEIVFVTKDQTGQIVWLEKGNSSAGLKHILYGDGKTPGHIEDFKKAFGIEKGNIPSFLKSVLSKGTVVSNTIITKNGHTGYERIYYYNGKHYVLTGIGTNGYIVTAYPIDY